MIATTAAAPWADVYTNLDRLRDMGIWLIAIIIVVIAVSLWQMTAGARASRRYDRSRRSGR